MVTAVNQQQPTQRGTILPQLIGTAGGAAIGGLAIGRHLAAKDVIKGDTFELSEEAKAKLNPQQTASSEAFDKVDKELKDKKYETDAKTAVSKYMGDATEMTTEDYAKAQQYASVEDLNTKLSESAKAVQDKMAEIKGVEDKIKSATDADKAGLESQLAKLKDELPGLKTKHEGHAIHSTVVASAKEGKITADGAKTALTASFKEKALKAMDEALEGLKGLTKKRGSWSKALLGGVAGLVLGIIAAKMFASED